MKRQIIIVLVAIVLLALLAGAVYASNQAPKLRDGTQSAVVAITIQTFSVTSGVTPTFASASTATNSFVNDGETFIEVKNASAAAVNITVTTASTVGGLAIADLSYTVPATTGDRMIGPFDPTLFNASDGTINVDFGGNVAATVTVAAFKLPRY